jgi:DnaK suppressor protein
MKTNDKKSGKKAKKRMNKDVAKKVRSLKGGKVALAKKAKSELRATFMQSILDKRQELEKILEGLMESQKEYNVQFSGGDLTDELDQAQREISASSYYPIIERKIKELRKIDLLIKRMSKEEKFGLCEECGKHIPKERLLIVPEASLCVSCQRKLEKTGLQRSAEARASTAYGGGQGMDWDTGGFDENGHLVMKSYMNTFSVNEIRGTETDNDFEPDAKRH